MPPPSYQHRHLLLTGLLDSLAPPPDDAFALNGSVNDRGCKLDALLLQGWTATGKAALSLDKDVLQHAENLRLKKADFEVLGRIGEGQFGVVDAVRSKLSGKVYAMKSIEKSMAMRAGSQLNLALERHIHGLAKANSPAPIFAAAFQSPTTLHLLTSYAACGSLWDRLCEMLPAPGLDTGKMDEDEVSWWGRQMVSSLSWLHGLGYVHRDIKPHNFLLLPDCRLQLTDFGSAAPLTAGHVPRRLCMLPTGTPDYVAPEVLRMAEDALVEAAHSDADETNATVRTEGPGYGPEVDWWSLGATLYEMAVGRAPFFSPSIGSTYERIMRCDVRMPNVLSPQLKSLLSGLLSPLDVRLGHGDAGQIRRHSFFSGVDWSRLESPPPGLVCTPIDLGTLAAAFDHDADDITFDHFFNTTMGFTTMTASPPIALPPAPVTWGRWVGWTLDPPAEYFGTETPAITISPPTLKPANVNLNTPAIGIRQHSAPPATHLFTPLRPSIGTPRTAPRTAPRSVPRTRPVSERAAFAELIKCVQASARKKLASSVQVPGSAVSASSASSRSTDAGWRKDHPPTPTPVSRDVTVLGTRPASRASMRAGDDGNMFPPRPLSRASSMSLRDAALLPPRSFSRATSLPLRDATRSSAEPEPLSHRPSLASLRAAATTPAASGSAAGSDSLRSGTSTADTVRSLTLASMSIASDFRPQRGSTPYHGYEAVPVPAPQQQQQVPLPPPPARSLSSASVRGSLARGNTSSLRDETFLSRLCAVEIEVGQKRGRERSRSASLEAEERPGTAGSGSTATASERRVHGSAASGVHSAGGSERQGSMRAAQKEYMLQQQQEHQQFQSPQTYGSSAGYVSPPQAVARPPQQQQQQQQRRESQVRDREIRPVPRDALRTSHPAQQQQRQASTTSDAHAYQYDSKYEHQHEHQFGQEYQREKESAYEPTYASLKSWHASLEDGFEDLERRLAALVARVS